MYDHITLTQRKTATTEMSGSRWLPGVVDNSQREGNIACSSDPQTHRSGPWTHLKQTALGGLRNVSLPLQSGSSPSYLQLVSPHEGLWMPYVQFTHHPKVNGPNDDWWAMGRRCNFRSGEELWSPACVKHNSKWQDLLTVFPSVHVAGTDAISGRGTLIQKEKLMNQRDESFIWTRLTFATNSTLDMCWL